MQTAPANWYIQSKQNTFLIAKNKSSLKIFHNKENAINMKFTREAMCRSKNLVSSWDGRKKKVNFRLTYLNNLKIMILKPIIK